MLLTSYANKKQKYHTIAKVRAKDHLKHVVLHYDQKNIFYRQSKIMMDVDIIIKTELVFVKHEIIMENHNLVKHFLKP